MNRLQFKIDIKADKIKVWKALWDNNSYRDWTSVFFEGSYAVTEDWKEGSKVLFLSPDQNGMYGIIEKHIPNEIMAFKHIGNVLNGKEQPVDDETLKWSGAMEIYKLTKGTDSNMLTVEIDVLDDHLDFMKTIFPKALDKVKALSEK